MLFSNAIVNKVAMTTPFTRGQFMKKFLAIPLFFVASLATAAISTPVIELNNEIAKILAPFQNEKTVANVVFQDIQTNDVRALSVVLGSQYKKIGSVNQFDLVISNLSYQYGDGTQPTTNFDGALAVDLTKFVSQDDLNGIIPGVEEILIDTAKNFTQEFGDAVQVTVNISEKNQDEAGNYVGIKGTIQFTVDLTKLPEGKLAQDVPVLSGNASIQLKVKEGVSISGTIVSNPAYYRFQNDNEGLKEILDKLLAKDAATLEQVKSLFEQIEEFAKQIVGE